MRQMPAQRTDEDCAVREDPDAPPLLHGSARIIIASTRAADGTYEDRTGPPLRRWLCGRGLTPPGPAGPARPPGRCGPVHVGDGVGEDTPTGAARDGTVGGCPPSVICSPSCC